MKTIYALPKKYGNNCTVFYTVCQGYMIPYAHHITSFRIVDGNNAAKKATLSNQIMTIKGAPSRVKTWKFAWSLSGIKKDLPSFSYHLTTTIRWRMPEKLL
jgi:hypothetical protein